MKKIVKYMFAWIVAFLTGNLALGLARISDFPFDLILVFLLNIIGLIVFLGILNLPEEKEAKY